LGNFAVSTCFDFKKQHNSEAGNMKQLQPKYSSEEDYHGQASFDLQVFAL